MAEKTSRPPETRVHRALSDPSRLGILHMLRQAEGPLDAQGIARAVGLHLSTVRSHLAVLSEAGLVARTERRGTRGRPRMLYTPTETPAGNTFAYHLLAQALASHIATSEAEPEASAERAGREWGAYLAPRPAPFTCPSREEAIDHLLRLHERLGFRPEVDRTPAEQRIVIRHCPFEDLARSYQSVVCPFHVGLVRGSLAGLGSDVEARVEPFAEPGTCIAHLEYV